MINPQTYGLTGGPGRKYRPNYVDIIEARKKFLPQKKALADEENYRNRSFALDERTLEENARIARETLEANKKSADTSSLIGLGQLAITSKQGFDKDKKLNDIISGGGGGKGATGTVTPTSPTAGTGDIGDTNPFGPSADNYGGGKAIGSISENAGKTDYWSGLKGGASNWGNITSSSLVGGTVGAGLGEKVFGKNTSSRVIGGAVTAGALSYLSSGDPYTAALSAIFGGSLGGFT